VPHLLVITRTFVSSKKGFTTSLFLFHLFYFGSSLLFTVDELFQHVLYILFSWFFTYNFLSEKIPKQETTMAELGRLALIGFCSSAVSDTCSNSIRIVKVYKQSHPDQLSYPQVVRMVLAESGVFGLFFRGLETKILANGLQGILFSILWKQFEEVLFPKQK
jgi:Mitochondrial carrier protein